MSDTKPVVLLTGSNGLIGSAIAARFKDEFTVVGLDLGEQRPGSPVAGFFPLDLASDDSVARALAAARERFGPRLASVVHLAAYYDFSGEPSPLYREVTVRGTARLLSRLQAFDVGQFVFSSTVLVHAPSLPGRRITETSPLEPKWDYPASKVETEEQLRRERSGIPLVVLRIAGVYDDLGHSIPIAQQIQRIYERKLVGRVFPGDTSHGQPFVHLDDVVEACRLTVRRRGELPPELVLLIGEPETLSYDALQRLIGRLIHGEEWETREIPKAVAKTGAWLQENMPIGEDPFIKPWMIDLADDHYELDVSRARDLLGWQPRRSLRETLPTIVRALEDAPERWYGENNLAPPSNLAGRAGAKGARA